MVGVQRSHVDGPACRAGLSPECKAWVNVESIQRDVKIAARQPMANPPPKEEPVLYVWPTCSVVRLRVIGSGSSLLIELHFGRWRRAPRQMHRPMRGGAYSGLATGDRLANGTQSKPATVTAATMTQASLMACANAAFSTSGASIARVPASSGPAGC